LHVYQEFFVSPGIFLPLDFIPSGETVVFGSLASISCITSGANQMSTLISPHILYLLISFFFLEGTF